MGKPFEKINPERKSARFAKEFKSEAVRLLELGQNPGTQLALELGIARNQLYKWQKELPPGVDPVFARFIGSQPTVFRVNQGLGKFKHHLRELDSIRVPHHSSRRQLSPRSVSNGSGPRCRGESGRLSLWCGAP